MTGHSFTPQPGCTTLCVCGEWDHHPVHGPDGDRLYLDLKGALERLRRAQTNMPAWWRADAQQAIVIVQMIGSAVCPDAWSKHDQPEYPEGDIVSIDIAAELRSWCIDAHLPSGASECLFCEAAQTVELYREEMYQLARLATAGCKGEASGRDRDVQLFVGRLAHRHRQDRLGARLKPLVTWPMDGGAAMSVLGAGFYGPTEGEKKRRRNATPWLPPLSCDPRLTSVPICGGVHTRYIVRNGPGGMTFTYDDLRDALVDLGRYVVACNAMHRSQERRQVLS